MHFKRKLWSFSLSRALQPDDPMQARQRIDLLQSMRSILRPYCFQLLGIFFGIMALRWAPWPLVAIWTAAVVFLPFFCMPLRRQLFEHHALSQAGELWLKALAVMIPSHLIWYAYVPMCWVAGDTANNAFLLIFLLAAFVTILLVYGPCIILSLPASLPYLLLIALFRMQTESWMDWAAPTVMILFYILLTMLAREQYKAFRQGWSRRLMIEDMARRLVTARDEAERTSAAKSSFLATLSHELRTPLNAIIGFSDMMRQSVYGPVQPEKYREYIEDVFSSGQHLLELINDVLDLSKIEAGKRELCESEIVLATLLQNSALLVSGLAKAAGVEIQVDAPPHQTIIADERALRQILLNYLSNAIKFSGSGGSITLFARQTEEGSITLGVEDHGMGMDAAGLRKALEPYGQIHPTAAPHGCKGTGLGLPIAKALTEAHGARFCIESNLGRGTRVWSEFPAEIKRHPVAGRHAPGPYKQF